MKATQEQYNQAVKIYTDGGQLAVEDFAEEIGIDEYEHCPGCQMGTPMCEDDSCLICGMSYPLDESVIQKMKETIEEAQEALEFAVKHNLSPFIPDEILQSLNSALISCNYMMKHFPPNN